MIGKIIIEKATQQFVCHEPSIRAAGASPASLHSKSINHQSHRRLKDLHIIRPDHSIARACRRDISAQAQQELREVCKAAICGSMQNCIALVVHRRQQARVCCQPSLQKQDRNGLRASLPQFLGSRIHGKNH